MIIERMLLVKFQCNETERLIVNSENGITIRKATSVLAASSRLDDQMAGNKVCSAETTQRPMNSTGHGTLETVERFLLAISRLIAHRCDTVSALQRGRASDDSGDASSIYRLSSVGGAFRGPCIST